MTPLARLSRRHPVRHLVDGIRGFLIGLAELVPGVSGGTVALVTGVYEQLIESASHVLAAVRRAVLGPDRREGFLEELRRTDWWLIGPVLVGMGTAVLTMAGVMSGFVAGSPEHARGLFFGMVAVSIVVPLGMFPPRLTTTRADRLRDTAYVAVAAALAFWLTSLAADDRTADPAYPVVFLAAAVAICALVVPGVSGSFFLLAVGLYEPTLTAVHERDLGYVAVFGAGALVGLASFVKLLHYLLRRRRRGTLLVMVGLMLGSLRALWPWQGEGRVVDGEVQAVGQLVAPYTPWVGPVALALVGAGAVLLMVLVERRLLAARTIADEHQEAGR